MKSKIALSLFIIFLLFTIGTVIVTFYINNTTESLNRLILLHQIEDIRQNLISNVKTVQADLYSVQTNVNNKLDSIVHNVINLEKAAQKCTSCHHPPTIKKLLKKVQSLIQDYETALSYTITTSANPEMTKKHKLEAVSIGSSILDITERMSFNAGKRLEIMTVKARADMEDARKILIITILLTSFFSILIALRLTHSVTKPIKILVDATRKISSGEFGYTLPFKDKTEFGELANHFNVMSTTIKDGYEKIQKEISEHQRTQQVLIKSEEFLNTIFDSIWDPFCIIDRQFNVIRANEAYAEMRNKDINDLIGKKCYEFLHKKNNVCKQCVVETTFKSGDPCARDKHIQLENGESLWMEIYTYPIFNDEGIITHVIEYTRDITDRKFTEEALKESEERYALAALGANDGLWDWDLRSNKLYLSPRWKSMLGFQDEDIGISPDEWLKRVHPFDRKQIETEITAHINGFTPHFENEYRALHKDGKYRWMLSRGLAVRDKSGKAYRVAGSQTDITERKMAEEQLIHDAFHDSLTGLPNRALFMDRLKHALDRKKRNSDFRFAVLFVDIDRFKVLNDSLGHPEGDKLLVEISRRFEKCVRPGDTVARFGGDEFSILLEDLKSDNDATSITERMHTEILSPFNLKGHDVFTTISTGITLSSSGYGQPEDMMRDADIAMYHAKSNGRSRYEIFHNGMYTDAVTRLQLETDMWQGLEKHEFIIHYQPIISLKDGSLIGFESLVRWQHPVNGLIGPKDFIPIAEETGLITSIGEWVLYEACRQMRSWQEQFPLNQHLSVSVNLSSKQFTPEIIGLIKKVLRNTGLEASSLILEITESMIMDNAEAAAPLLLQLKDMNVGLQIDDFGTGYSSLNYLHHFPIDALKIDRSFISKMGLNDSDLEIVRTITTLAHNLKMTVIAEGVETAEQLEKLKNMQCDYVQGFLFCKPIDSKKVEALLKQKRINISHLRLLKDTG